MKKLTGMERGVLLLTALFFLLTSLWFFFENQTHDLTRITVSRPESAEIAPVVAEENPAPGILVGERININIASAEELTRLPGIGEVKAANIVAYREANGPFASAEGLINVSGIGQATLEKLLDYITVEEEGGADNAEDFSGG